MLMLMRITVPLLMLGLSGCAGVVMGLSAAASVATIARDGVQIDEALSECNPAKAPAYFKRVWSGCETPPQPKQ